ncbi:MAG: type I-E CRISPR-associated protein Cas6/Cse3/CasE [Acetivibrionales bacterium]|jgi:CRISPR system Cascade subunit CasE
MYLSRVALNTKRKNTMVALSSPQKIHAAVENSFPPDAINKIRNLWRIDRLGKDLFLLVLSNVKPDFTHIIEQFGWPESEQKWETRDYSILLERIKTGQRWQFRLLANPVHSVKQTDKLSPHEQTKRSKIYAHVTVKQQGKWLLDRAAKNGFSIQEGNFSVIHREVKKFRRHGKIVTLGIATFEGILEVTDVTLFLRTLTNGIGRAKAYGCGMLTITGVSS